ncbi:MAG: AEC family transporter [Collinsella sp.]
MTASQRPRLPGLSGLNTGLAMIVLGSYLAQADLRGILRNKNLYLTHFIRLVVVPLIIVAILWVMPLSTPIKLTLLIAFAAPSGTVAAIFPQMFNKDYSVRGGAGVFIDPVVPAHHAHHAQHRPHGVLRKSLSVRGVGTRCARCPLRQNKTRWQSSLKPMHGEMHGLE